MTIIMATW